MKRYVKTSKGIIDTEIRNNPHVECFFIIDDILHIEEISGRIFPYAKVIDLSNNKDDLIAGEEFDAGTN